MNSTKTLPQLFCLTLATTSIHAAVIVDDHFDDNSTSGWTENLFGGTGSIVESGTSVILTSTRGTGGGGPMVMANNTLANSSGTPATNITVAVDSINGTDPEGSFIFGMLDDSFGGFFVVNARLSQGGLDLRIEAGSPGGGGGDPANERLIPLATIPYTLGNPLLFTLNFDSDSVSVTEGGGYNSGDLAYATSFEDGNGTPVPGYNPLGLLTDDSFVALVSNARTDLTELSVSVNRITLDGEAAPVPEPSVGALFGGLALFGLLRRRARS